MRYIVLILCLIYTNNVIAFVNNKNFSSNKNFRPNTYYSDYKVNHHDNSTIIKLSGSWYLPHCLPLDTHSEYIQQNFDTSSIIEFGYAMTGSISQFISKYITIEAGVGPGAFHLNQVSTTVDIANTLYAIPVYGTVQYNPYPYGGIIPYLGVGYSTIFLFSPYRLAVKTDSIYAPVLQIGTNFAINNTDSIFSVSLMKYWTNNISITQKTYTQTTTSNGNTATNTTPAAQVGSFDLSPIVITFSFGFKL